MEDKILQLEVENKELIKQLQTSQVLVKKSQVKNQELLMNKHKLLEKRFLE